MAVGIGWSWGSGTLTYKGKKHRVKVEGPSVGEVGIVRAHRARRRVRSQEARGLLGNYVAGGAGVTVGGGAGATIMKNQNGVEIPLRAKTFEPTPATTMPGALRDLTSKSY